MSNDIVHLFFAILDPNKTEKITNPYNIKVINKIDLVFIKNGSKLKLLLKEMPAYL